MSAIKSVIAAGFAIVMSSIAVIANEVTGAGATLPYPIYIKWADVYKNRTGIAIGYDFAGSGGGIKYVRQGLVTFGASDMPLPQKALEKDGMVQVPTVIAGIVPVVNIAGVKPGELVLDGATLANIFYGQIKSWDDPAIKKLNPSLKLPNKAIAVVHRSDGSGTTYNFMKFLLKASEVWKDDGSANLWAQWPVGIGAKGNDSVAGNVHNTSNSIGYVGYAHALAANLAYVKMVNRSGNIVSPSVETFSAAASGADLRSKSDFEIDLTDQADSNAWPITAVTYIMMHRRPRDPPAARDAIRFFVWALSDGEKYATQLGYVSLPKEVVTRVVDVLSTQVRDADGRAAYIIGKIDSPSSAHVDERSDLFGRIARFFRSQAAIRDGN